jgi:hypothetical protein
MIMTRILAAAFLTLTAVIGLTVAGRADEPDASRYTSAQAINHSFGSKRAVGYFASQDGNCALTMFLAEAEDGHVAPSAARIRLTVKPGDAAELTSAEGGSIEVRCGKNAGAVEVRSTGLKTAAATQ